MFKWTLVLHFLLYRPGSCGLLWSVKYVRVWLCLFILSARMLLDWALKVCVVHEHYTQQGPRYYTYKKQLECTWLKQSTIKNRCVLNPSEGTIRQVQQEINELIVSYQEIILLTLTERPSQRDWKGNYLPAGHREKSLDEVFMTCAIPVYCKLLSYNHWMSQILLHCIFMH